MRIKCNFAIFLNNITFCRDFLKDCIICSFTGIICRKAASEKPAGAFSQKRF